MGNFLEAMDGVEATHAMRPKLLSKETVRRVFSPPLVGFLSAARRLSRRHRLYPRGRARSGRHSLGRTIPRRHHDAARPDLHRDYDLHDRDPQRPLRQGPHARLPRAIRDLPARVSRAHAGLWALAPLHERLRNPGVSSLYHADCGACKVPSRRHEVRHDRRGGDDARIRRDFAGVDDDSDSTRLSIAKQNGLETVICTKKVKFFL